MNICGKCGKGTNSDYIARQFGILCAECANKELDIEIRRLSSEIDLLISQKTALNKEKIRLNQLDCKHEWKDTGYGIQTEKGYQSVFCCTRCNKREYSEECINGRDGKM